MEAVKEILDKISSREIFVHIKRQKFAYSLANAIETVIAIGKSRASAFVIDRNNEFAYTNMVRWLMGDEEMRCLDPTTKQVIPGRLDAGIYVAGGTGTGKSWLLEIMSALCVVDEPQLFIGEQAVPLKWVNYRADDICDAYAKEGTIERFKSAIVLGIQDLGSEPRETLHMGNRVQVLAALLEHRGDRTDCITLISSNYPMAHKSLEEIYGTRVVSRLSQMCNYFEIKGADRRKK